MPELPEVETIVRNLRPQLIGKEIVEADVHWARTIAMPSVKKFKEQIQGQKIIDVSRRAKFLNIKLNAYNLIIHLRMSGDLTIKQGKIKAEKHDRLILLLHAPFSAQKSNAGGRVQSNLVFNDTRKFGRVWLTDNIEKVFGKLGPEPLSDEFTPRWLVDALQSRHRQLKPLLLDQTFLAGLGNIYTDESLHMARLHPLALSDSVNAKQAERLHHAIQTILHEGIRRNGASIDWVYRGGEFQNQFRVYGREGEECQVCGTRIKKIVVGQRGTHFCPKCQKE